MPTRSAQGVRRSDCEHLAKCGRHSLYFCKMYCAYSPECEHLSERSKVARRRATKGK